MKQEIEALIRLLKNDDIYDVVTALRGPDTENTALKRIFTLFIRGRLGVPPYWEYTNLKIPFGVVVEAILTVDENDMHYLNHTSRALGVMKKHGLITEDEFQVLDALIDILRGVIYASKTTDEVNAVREMDMALSFLGELLEKAEAIICE